MDIFAPQLRWGRQTTHSLRASQYRRPTKRKHDEDEDDAAAGPSATSNAQSFASSEPLEAEQLRVAGLLPDDAFELPPPPFPHTPAAASKGQFTYASVAEEMASLTPAVFDPAGGTSDKRALRQKHLEILSTVMHRCLLEGDYDRASRAWGMILRTQAAGRPIDPRNHERWTISAELLLRRKPSSESNYIRNEGVHARSPDEEQPQVHEDETFTEDGFELALDYLKRLTVQYPYRKLAPRAVDARTFLPPYFELRIREVYEKSKHAHAHEAALREEELAQARDICKELDGKMESPPFDKHEGLLQLRVKLGLWISDLILGTAQSGGEDDRNMDTSEDGDNTGHMAPEKQAKYTDALRELRQVLEACKRAGIEPGPLRRNMPDLVAKIEELKTPLGIKGSILDHLPP
ncbi:hypothetical protein BU26DRAFT_493722 [Trematosphaeria pertusa]|uniref:Uncharacterized protein n=1 Tax=Trematosphaeria pertusa TaxID=390896 RepID=A0A6A6HY13_9PLEO|nr:uncharacterized protein BU26DRAFT_493722 [Trematosphaeria pertusa]KAF2242936.1 hypothetical protein BU26DRAFT_493722 [Trematosphaeria pertusa]